ncbi:PTS system mannose/fructose/sorbose family transporter subunit IID [Amphibacillus sediminis]|uniref:PTS system mannose/fructose/sorbose family transporter subunit IID n=1 Tax=Amphibacillus sediminis TaxID=360185 RepID=UPI0008296F96|nr:PTS system mannose/fructose/sorbose family transporter subunit IID [Amphibacillus sediminis]
MTSSERKKVTKKDLRQVFWRSFALQGAFNYERMQNLGFGYAMLPIIKRLYQKKADQTAAMERHLEIFNTTPQVSPLIMGISAAMEEENANSEGFDVNSINAVKASLMGPLAGIGDSLFWGTFRIIAAGIGVSLALNGNILGPILFLILFNIPHLLLRILGLKYGYEVGVNSLERIQREGLMDTVMNVVTIVGLLVVGALVGSLLNINTPLVFEVSGAEVVIQDIIDSILPNMLPLAFVFILFKLIRKNVSVTKLTLSTLVVGIVLSIIGIL